MITLKRPTDNQIRKMLQDVADAPFTYDAVGCVSRETPSGFKRDTARFLLGTGEDTWQAARAAVEAWAIFPVEMASMVGLSDRIETGTVVAVVCPSLGTWATCPARILSTEDSLAAGVHRFGFTYGTLPGHIECGEELFCVEWNTATDEVSYRIEAVSRPMHILCWLAYPYTRMMQAKFRRLSGESIQRFVSQYTEAVSLQLV